MGEGKLTAESDRVRLFQKNGFLILKNLLSEDEIAPISDEIDRILTGTVGYVPEHDLVYEPGSTQPRRVRSVFRIHHYNPFFMGLARHPKVVTVVEELLGRPLRLYSSQLFAKPGEVGSKVPLHQDAPYWPFAPPEMVSCWFALDDSTRENGCVRFLVGSHKLGMLRHVPSGVAGNSLRLEDPRIEGLREQAVEVPRGSCVIHHCLTAHYSEPNKSPRPRRGLIMIYMSPRVRLTDPDQIKGPVDFPVIRHNGPHSGETSSQA